MGGERQEQLRKSKLYAVTYITYLKLSVHYSIDATFQTRQSYIVDDIVAVYDVILNIAVWRVQSRHSIYGVRQGTLLIAWCNTPYSVLSSINPLPNERKGTRRNLNAMRLNPHSDA